MLPIINPKVAEATATVVALATPIPSSIGPNDPAVPCPPTIGMDPVQRPSKGFKLKSEVSMTPIVFCKVTSNAARPRKIITCLPPYFKILKLAVNPILVKKAVINKFCKLISRLIVAKFVSCSNKMNKAKINPPTTAGGTQYFDKIENLFLVYRPR